MPLPKVSGSHRSRPPRDTLEAVRPHLARLGITRLANVTGLDRVGIPVTMAVRPNARSLSVSQGKGADLASSQASGVMEAIELWHAENVLLPLRLAPASGLRDAVDVERLPRPVGSRFSPSLPILWIRASDLRDERPVWVPYETVHVLRVLPPPEGRGCFLATSNGLASGNHWLEALCHGLCEVIERDAVAVWNASSPTAKHATGLRLDTVDDPVCSALIERFHEAGVRLAVWEVTSDIGLPAFACLAVDDDSGAPWRMLPAGYGAGCHPCRGVALSRALTEAAQTRLTLISGMRDDLPRTEYARLLDADRQGHTRRLVEQQRPPRDFRAAPTWDTDHVDEDLRLILDALARRGLDQVLAVDLSQVPEVAVARVLVPGLEGPVESPKYVPGPRARAMEACA